eukprot:COSAG01_NODE_52386_length_347_cov_0.616935_1_plen_89_part_00
MGARRINELCPCVRAGLELGDGVSVAVHDSTADMRYLVLPQRPAGTEGWTEAELARLVTRDALVGVCNPVVVAPGDPAAAASAAAAAL